MSLAKGDTAPDFVVTDTEGKRLVLSELVADGPVIVAFFPKAFTPGWTRELTSYRSRYDELAERKATIIAVSGDREAKQEAFRREIGAPFSFVADPKAALIKQFGVKMPLVKLAKRTTFVIGAERKILEVISGGDAVDPSSAIAACPIG